MLRQRHGLVALAAVVVVIVWLEYRLLGALTSRYFFFFRNSLSTTPLSPEVDDNQKLDEDHDDEAQNHNNLSLEDLHLRPLLPSGNTSLTRNFEHTNNHSSADTANDPDRDCIFRQSPLYRKVYVYPSPGEAEYGNANSRILSDEGRERVRAALAANATVPQFPWQVYDQESRERTSALYNVNGEASQYATELIVREILTHPDSCLRTHNPDQADLFYIPYLLATEMHQAKEGKPRGAARNVSLHSQALLNAIEENDFALWHEAFGWTSDYWKRRNGADHVLVMPKPLTGLRHPMELRGHYHYVHTQKQLSPLIVIVVEQSAAFVQQYPHCSTHKNILLPYPIVDGRVYKGQYDAEAQRVRNHLPDKQAAEEDTNTATANDYATQWYQGGLHGSCRNLRQSLHSDHLCSESVQKLKVLPLLLLANNNKTLHNNNQRQAKQHKKQRSRKQRQFQKDNPQTLVQSGLYSVGMRLSTFCPCPTGDSPSAKRPYDALLAGCVPVVLAGDFVWPFSTEQHQHNASFADNTRRLLHPPDFSLRLSSRDFATPHLDPHTCQPRRRSDSPSLTGPLEEVLNQIPRETAQRLRQGLRQASKLYSFYNDESSDDNKLPDLPLSAGILPNGGAAHALVDALAQRARGVQWPGCYAEIQQASAQGRRVAAEPASFEC